MVVIVLTSAIALFLATAGAVGYEFLRFHRDKVIDLEAQARVLESNVAQPLAGGDMKAAREILSGLRTQREIVSARIYDPEGRLFAEYVQPDARPLPIAQLSQTRGYRFEGHYLLFYSPIRFGERPLGTLVLRTDIRELQNRFKGGAAILVVVMLASVLTAMLVAGLIQRIISRPILDLARMARTVAEKKDYSLRAARTDDGEIGFLTESFNQMLAQIQVRDAERKVLEKRLLEVTDREQARIGQDIHDGLCQQLVGASINVALLKEDLPAMAALAMERADKIATLLTGAIAQARNLARGLYPVKLETEGLVSALQELAVKVTNQFHIACEVEWPGPAPAYDYSMTLHLYRIASEAVCNALRHAGATRILIHLTVDGNIARLSISDDGMGFSTDSVATPGMGLHIMRYRSEMIGGTLSIRQNDTGGTTISCVFEQNGSTTAEPSGRPGETSSVPVATSICS